LIVDGHAWTVGQMTWTAVANSVPTDPFPKYPAYGIRGFNFEIFQSLKKQLKQKLGHRLNRTPSRPYLKLLIHFWPGDWQQHWRKLKAAFQVENALRIRTAGEKAKKLRSPSQNEFWRFIGLILAGGLGSMVRVELACGSLAKSSFTCYLGDPKKFALLHREAKSQYRTPQRWVFVWCDFSTK
jgi:hypothetical protein